MKLRFNSYTNELTIESIYKIDDAALKILKDFFVSFGIDSSLPWVEYDTRITRLLIILDDTRFKIWNDELQLGLVTDVLVLLNKFGISLLTEYTPDSDVYMEAALQVQEFDSLTNWLTRTESYPNLVSIPYESNRSNEYTLKTIGQWSELELFEYLKTLPEVIRNQAIIRGNEFKKYIIVSEKNANDQTIFQALQELAKAKEAIKVEEFGDYRFYLP
jgi:hypothetical protein